MRTIIEPDERHSLIFMEHHGTFVTTFLLCFAHILEAAVISTFYDMENQGKSWKHIRRYDIRLPGSESMAEIETVWHIDIVDPTKASPNVVACGPCGDVTLGETNDLWPRNQGTTRYNKVQQGTTRCSQLGIWPYIAVVNQKANGLEGCGLGFMFAQCWTRSMLFQ